MRDLSAGELERLLAARVGRRDADARNRALVAVLSGTGLSLAEALAARVDDVDPGEGRIRVGGRRPRDARLEGEALAAVRAWVEERPAFASGAGQSLFCTRQGQALESSYVRRLLARMGRAADVGVAVNARVLRDTFIARCAEAGAQAEEVARELGHAAVAATRRRLREAARVREPPPDAEPALPSGDLLDLAECGLGVAAAERDAAGKIVDFRLEYLNRFGAGLFGLCPDDVVGRRVSERFPDLWDGPIVAMWVGAIESGLVSESRERRIDEHGGARTFAVRRVPSGDRLLLVYSETTGERRTSAALRAAEVRWQALLDISHDGVIELDSDGRVVTVSASAERILGMPGDRLIGRDIADERWRSSALDGSPLAPGERATDVVRLTGETVRRRRRRFRRGDGGAARVEISVERLAAGGERPFPVLAVISDIGPLLDAQADSEAAWEALGVALEDLGGAAVVRSPGGQVRLMLGPVEEILDVPRDRIAAATDLPGLSAGGAARLRDLRRAALEGRASGRAVVRIGGAAVEVRVVGLGGDPEGDPAAMLEILRRADGGAASGSGLRGR